MFFLSLFSTPSTFADNLFIKHCRKYKEAIKQKDWAKAQSYSIVKFAENHVFKTDKNRRYPFRIFKSYKEKYKSRCEMLDGWMQDITYLDISQGDDKEIDNITDFRSISEFDNIVNLKATGHGLKSIKGIENLKNLQTLDISDNELEDISWNQISELENLEDLNLSNNRFTNIYLPNSKLHNLEKLKLYNNAITNVSMKNLYRWLPRLNNLNLERNFLTSFKLQSPWDSNLTVNIKNNLVEIEPLKFQNITIHWYPQGSYTATSRDESLKDIDLAEEKGKSETLWLQGFHKKAPDFDSYFYALMGSVRSCNLENFEYLHDKFPGDWKYLYQSKSSGGDTPLLALAKNDIQSVRCIKIAEIMLPYIERSTLIMEDENGRDALYHSVNRKSTQLANVILMYNPGRDSARKASEATIDENVKNALLNVPEYYQGTPPIIPNEKQDLLEKLDRVESNLRNNNVDGDTADIIRWACSTLQNHHTAIGNLQNSDHFSRLNLKCLELWISIKNSPLISEDESKEIMGYGTIGKPVFDFVQGAILNYFIASEMISSGKFNVAEDAKTKSWSVALVGSAVTGVKMAGKFFPIYGILPTIGFIAGFGVKKLEKEQLEETKRVYEHADDFGSGNIFSQGEFAKKLALNILKEQRLGYIITEENFPEFRRLFKKYIEVSIFNQYLKLEQKKNIKVNKDVEIEALAETTMRAIRDHKDPDLVWKIYKDIPNYVYSGLKAVANLDGYSLSKMADSLKEYLANDEVENCLIVD